MMEFFIFNSERLSSLNDITGVSASFDIGREMKQKKSHSFLAELNLFIQYGKKLIVLKNLMKNLIAGNNI